QLHQVLMNLCVNARDAMLAGGTLTLSARNRRLEAADVILEPQAREGHFVLITVADNGAGIPREHLHRIFEPFFTTKEVGRGTGLGLSPVIGIVKSRGVFVLVYSEPDRGSAFHIYPPADPQVTDAAKASPAALPHGNQELILIVDDE